jgi:hypothetical protein
VNGPKERESGFSPARTSMQFMHCGLVFAHSQSRNVVRGGVQLDAFAQSCSMYSMMSQVVLPFPHLFRPAGHPCGHCLWDSRME